MFLRVALAVGDENIFGANNALTLMAAERAGEPNVRIYQLLPAKHTFEELPANIR